MQAPVDSKDLIALEDRYGAHNYHPLDVVIERAQGAWVEDAEGHRYLDFLAAYSAVNQGHCHPAIRKAMIDQAEKVTLTSRAFPIFTAGALQSLAYDPARGTFDIRAVSPAVAYGDRSRATVVFVPSARLAVSGARFRASKNTGDHRGDAESAAKKTPLILHLRVLRVSAVHTFF